jgi:hypothetical protein
VVHPAGTLAPHTEPVWLRELKAAGERLGVRSVEIEIRYGAVGDQIRARARNARLLVLGS